MAPLYLPRPAVAAQATHCLDRRARLIKSHHAVAATLRPRLRGRRPRRYRPFGARRIRTHQNQCALARGSARLGPVQSCVSSAPDASSSAHTNGRGLSSGRSWRRDICLGRLSPRKRRMVTAAGRDWASRTARSNQRAFALYACANRSELPPGNVARRSPGCLPKRDASPPRVSRGWTG